MAIGQHIGNQSIKHYMDDFFLVAHNEARELLRRHSQSVPRTPHPARGGKCVPPTTRLVPLAVEFDTDSMTISLPHDKSTAILGELRDLHQRRIANKRKLLSVVEKLLHAAKCIASGREFIRRILDAALTIDRLGHGVRITTALRRDIQWWLEFLPGWNGSFFIILKRLSGYCRTAHTDSSGFAGAAVHHNTARSAFYGCPLQRRRRNAR